MQRQFTTSVGPARCRNFEGPPGQRQDVGGRSAVTGGYQRVEAGYGKIELRDCERDEGAHEIMRRFVLTCQVDLLDCLVWDIWVVVRAGSRFLLLHYCNTPTLCYPTTPCYSELEMYKQVGVRL